MPNKKDSLPSFLTNTDAVPDIFELVGAKNTTTQALPTEGELLVDVYQDPKNLFVRSTIAGATLDNLEIHFNNNTLTIRGERSSAKKVPQDDYLHQECYWGSFSRSIVLPMPIKADKISATLEAGILTIKLPKA